MSTNFPIESDRHRLAGEYRAHLRRARSVDRVRNVMGDVHQLRAAGLLAADDVEALHRLSLDRLARIAGRKAVR